MFDPCRKNCTKQKDLLIPKRNLKTKAKALCYKRKIKCTGAVETAQMNKHHKDDEENFCTNIRKNIKVQT